MDKLQKFKNPLHMLNTKMPSLDIPTVGPFAEEAQKVAELEIKKLDSQEKFVDRLKI